MKNLTTEAQISQRTHRRTLARRRYHRQAPTHLGLSGVPGPPSLKAGPLDRLKRAEPEDTVIIYFAGHGTAGATVLSHST